MRTLILMPVGTSLLENRGGTVRAANELNSLNYSCQVLSTALRGAAARCHVSQDTTSLGSHFNALLTEKGIAKELEFRSFVGKERADRLAQEMSYLAVLQKELSSLSPAPATPIDVALIASDSRDGELCADFIGTCIERSEPPWSSFQLVRSNGARYHKVSDLRVHAAKSGEQVAATFRDVGVPNLLAKCLDLVRETKQSNGAEELQVFLNLTGGFKGSIPYTTLAANFLEADRVELHYLFETSAEIIRLPLYPIGLDFPLWRRQARLLELAKDASGSKYDQVLDPRMRSVRDRSKGLPQLLSTAYDTQRMTSPLQHQAEEVVRALRLSGDLAKSARNLVQLGDRIWLGDKLPMAADHASKHHTDLLEIALCLLLPLLDAKDGSGKEFLNETERYALLGAVLLHDSGHTLDRLPLQANGPSTGLPGVGSISTEAPMVPLFRSEIRELHHFLAYHRICGPESDLAADLFASRELRQAIATLGVYHRKRTGWDQEETALGKGLCPFWNVRLEPPTAVGFTALQIDFPKLVALLRLIDGCDNQLGRVGDSADQGSFVSLLERDRQTWIVRLRELSSCLNAAWPAEKGGCPALDRLSVDEWECAGKLKDAISNWLADGDRDSRPPQLGDYSATNQVWEVRRKLGGAIAAGEASCAAQAWLEVVRALDEIALRDRQEIHFVKHRCVEEIEVSTHHEAGDSAWRVEVCLHEPRDPDLRCKLDCSSWFAKHKDDAGTEKDTLRAWIEEEIVAELKPLPDADQGPIQCLKAALGGKFEVVFRWVDSYCGTKEPFFPQSAPAAPSTSQASPEVFE